MVYFSPHSLATFCAKWTVSCTTSSLVGGNAIFSMYPIDCWGSLSWWIREFHPPHRSIILQQTGQHPYLVHSFYCLDVFRSLTAGTLVPAVLMATSHSYGNSQNSTPPHKIIGKCCHGRSSLVSDVLDTILVRLYTTFLCIVRRGQWSRGLVLVHPPLTAMTQPPPLPSLLPLPLFNGGPGYYHGKCLELKILVGEFYSICKLL